MSLRCIYNTLDTRRALTKNDGLNLESAAFVAQNYSILRRSLFANIVSFFAKDIYIRFKDEQVLNKADSILCIFYFHHYVFTLQQLASNTFAISLSLWFISTQDKDIAFLNANFLPHAQFYKCYNADSRLLILKAD